MQNQNTPNCFGVISICFQVAGFQNYLSVCSRRKKDDLKQKLLYSMLVNRFPFNARKTGRLYGIAHFKSLSLLEKLFSCRLVAKHTSRKGAQRDVKTMLFETFAKGGRMESYWSVMSKEMLRSLPNIFVNMNTAIAMYYRFKHQK